MRLTELVTPLKPLEAMAMGKPVLASDVGGLAELIEDGVTGVLFAAESRRAFVDAAERLVHGADARRDMAERGRQAVAQRTWRQMVGRYVSLYRELY